MIRNELGDTGAGWRRPFAGQPPAWTCDCRVDESRVRKVNGGHLVKCPDCGRERPHVK